MDRNLKVVLWLGLVLIGFVAVLAVFSSDGPIVNEDVSLEKFNSYDELKNFLQENTQQNNGGFGLLGGTAEVARATDTSLPSTLQAGTTSSESGGSAGTYSQTNIQVAGVDEPDVVKNDGKYIYQIVQNNRVVIVDAFPATEMKIVSELEFDNNVVGLFVNENKLIVLEVVYGYYYGYGAPEVADAVLTARVASSSIIANPEPAAQPEVRIHVYDLSDITSPDLEDTFVSKGNYYTARMIDGVVYVVSNYYANYENPVLPVFTSDSETREIAVSDIYYPVIGDSSFLFTSVLAVDVDELEFSGNVFLTGNNGISYVSQDAIYLTNQKYFNYQNFQEDMIREVFLPMLPAEIRADAEEILDRDGEYYTKTQDLEQVYAKYFNEIDSNEKIAYQNELQESMQEFVSSWSKKYQRTAIHKIELNGLDISYAGSGEVPGYLLNQFSLDENDGYLRVATTTGQMWWGAGSTTTGNNLYILDEDLEIVGSVEDLAPGERIYSVRFVGDKAYMVTFRQVDPLYVIDLSDEENPKVLGYLKVTGFSNYLQPYDENHLIGIGHEATLEGRSQGLKISLFDVSDFENPVEVDKYVVEGGWSSSEAEYEHKAVLFDREKNLLVIPVSVNSYDYNNYWQGVYVFNVNTDGVGLRGKVNHWQEKTEIARGDSAYGQPYVRRSLYLDNVLYTISEQKIKANDLNSLDYINSLELPKSSEVIPIVVY